jgi:hypothetical protein
VSKGGALSIAPLPSPPRPIGSPTTDPAPPPQQIHLFKRSVQLYFKCWRPAPQLIIFRCVFYGVICFVWSLFSTFNCVTLLRFLSFPFQVNLFKGVVVFIWRFLCLFYLIAVIFLFKVHFNVPFNVPFYVCVFHTPVFHQYNLLLLQVSFSINFNVVDWFIFAFRFEIMYWDSSAIVLRSFGRLTFKSHLVMLKTPFHH